MKLGLFFFFISTGGFLFWFDRADRQQAYNDAVERGEYLREEMARFFQSHQSYPETLEALKISNIPGQRWFGKTIILYQKNGSGYRLYFSDRFLAWEASDAHPFEAHK